MSWYVDRQPLVARLDVQLERHFTVYYQERDKRRASDRKSSGTKTAERFESKKAHQTTRALSYSKYAIYFIWMRTGKK